MLENEMYELSSNLIKEAEIKKTHLRLLGGFGIYLNSPTARTNPNFRRNYNDLDFVVDNKGSKHLRDIFFSLGWDENRSFNALHGKTRLIFNYQGELDADVFISVFEQCHKLNFEKRVCLGSLTLPVTDLLLTKLQIHQLNPKDAQDTICLLLDHELGSPDHISGIDLDYLIRITRNDWGWYTTIMDNLEFLNEISGEYLQGSELSILRSRLSSLIYVIKVSRKSIRWYVRNIMGKKICWYELPEEVRR